MSLENALLGAYAAGCRLAFASCAVPAAPEGLRVLECAKAGTALHAALGASLAGARALAVLAEPAQLPESSVAGGVAVLMPGAGEAYASLRAAFAASEAGDRPVALDPERDYAAQAETPEPRKYRKEPERFVLGSSREEMCAGCPYRGAYYAASKLWLRTIGDGGCSLLGAKRPFLALDAAWGRGTAAAALAGFTAALPESRRDTAAVMGAEDAEADSLRLLARTGGTLVLVGGLLVGQIFYVGFKSNAVDATGYRVGALADALKQTETGLQWNREHTPAEWMQGYAWAMVLDDNGNVIWQQDLPQKLNHRYTASEVAVFSHWYLADYPVQCWAADYGLFVVAEPVGTCWKYNINMNQKMIMMLGKSIQPTMVELLLVVLGCCLFFSWRGNKSLQTVTAGLDTLAQGGTVSLPAAGFAGELAQKLNETSEQLRRRNEIIARRDTARTEWIAGVSHDIRTPLALILGWAEQLQREATLPAAARQKAGGICTQCEKIRSLIEDLNLTSKLQYGAQPLRRRSAQAGPFLRRVVAAFCENPLAARCTLDCSITPAVETAILHADAALLTRALENVLQNAVRHNAGPITLAFHADADETTLHLTIQDDGTGYPQSVLAVLNGEPEGENAPHILGLHVVEQIINAHGGSVQFVNRDPHGAKVMMQLPLTKDENEK